MLGGGSEEDGQVRNHITVIGEADPPIAVLPAPGQYLIEFGEVAHVLWMAAIFVCVTLLPAEIQYTVFTQIMIVGDNRQTLHVGHMPHADHWGNQNFAVHCGVSVDGAFCCGGVAPPTSSTSMFCSMAISSGDGVSVSWSMPVDTISLIRFST